MEGEIKGRGYRTLISTFFPQNATPYLKMVCMPAAESFLKNKLSRKGNYGKATSENNRHHK